MLGAIIGDIVGSYYEVLEMEALKDHQKQKRSYEERIKILDSKTPLFLEKSSYTDDTVLTCAIANSLLQNEDYEKNLRYFGLKEINKGLDKYGRYPFGAGFIKWVKDEKIGDSYGNGGAMRISPVAYFAQDLEDVLLETEKATKPSHNTEEAIKGAQAVSTAIYLALNHHGKEEIEKTISELFAYDLHFDLSDLQHNYKFTARTCNSVPQAIYCFLISNSFEDALRKSISIGGDSDTIAAIACAISEAYYGIPENLKSQAYTYLPKEYRQIVENFYEELTLIKALNEVNINDKSFLKYMRQNCKKYNLPKETGLWGCFINKDQNDIITGVRIIVPNIINTDTLLINIHEYTHAYEIYKRIGEKDNLNQEQEETKARQNEALYLKKIINQN